MKRFKIVFLALCIVCTMLIGQTISNKRGVGFDLNNSRDAVALATGVSWFYNWGVQPGANIRGSYGSYGLDYVPMTWGGSFDENTLRAFLSSHPNVKYLLGFNEPNFTSQSNLTPSQAVALWPKLEKIAQDFNLQLVGPAVNYSGDNLIENGVNYNDPIKYYDDFFKLYPTAKVDFIGIHYYVDNVNNLDYHISRLYKYGKKIWLTEYNLDKGPTETADEQLDFAVKSIHYLENNPNIFRYAWFLGRANGYPTISLLDTNYGTLTPLGYVYTKMSSYDSTYYHQFDTDIAAEQYLNMNGVSVCNLSTNSSDVYIGYIDTNDWLDYNVEIPEDGSFLFSAKIASMQISSFQITPTNGDVTTLDLPNTGGWENWVWVSKTLSLKKGKYKIRLKANTSNVNLDSFLISPSTTGLEDVNSSDIKPYFLNITKNQITLNSNDLMCVDLYNILGSQLDKLTGNYITFNRELNSKLTILKISINDKTYIEKVF